MDRASRKRSHPKRRRSERPGGASRSALRGVVLRAAIVLGGVAALWLAWTLPGRLDGSGAPEPQLVSDPTEAKHFQPGRGLYAEHCASCHGSKLEGEPGWQRRRPDGAFPAPPHDGSGHTWHHPDSQLFRITKHGGQATAPPGFRSRMPGFADELTDEEIRAVLFYIKQQWSEEQRTYQESQTARAGRR